MNLKFEKVLERDVDLLIISKLNNDNNFINFFLSKIDLNNCTIEEIEHSSKDNDGESDITIILNNSKEKIGLLIEDKIDAIAMPNQKERYNIRGNKGIDNKKYDNFYSSTSRLS